MIRRTDQGAAIRSVLEHAHRPLTPQEVLEGAQLKVPGLGIATVYRQLRAMSEEGWLTTVELPGEPARYEVADLAHHHHFHCDRCGRVFDLHGCMGHVQELLPAGFQMKRHELLVFGQCPECV